MKRKKTDAKIWWDNDCLVVGGRLVPGPGHPGKTSRLFQFVGEKLPYDSLGKVKACVKERSNDLEGVYLAHDSMGVARYGGRGDIFGRLASHKRKFPKALLYFSFFIVKNKNHEREIETAILRAASPQMTLNQRKIRSGLEAGKVTDYEPGTLFIERQSRRGKKRRPRRRTSD